MDTELMELARTVDLTVLGQRVRDARVARGLTQTQVAGEEMSTGYVSRIESGKRRPDPELLEAIAARVGTTVDQLVMGTTRDDRNELQLLIDMAQMSLKTGSAVEALRGADEVLARTATARLPELQREALHLKATALEAVGRTDDAIIMLEDLADDETRDLTWVVGLASLCRCYRNAGDLTRAIETGQRALVRVKEAGLSGTYEATALHMSLVAAHFEHGETGHAARLCQRAITDAEQVNSPSALAAAYWNASIIESRLGRAAAAVPLARKALIYVEIGDDYRQRARLRSQLGLLQIRSGSTHAGEALNNLRQAQVDFETTDASATDLAANRLGQARANFLLGNLTDAQLDLAEARVSAEGHAPLIAADARVLAGQIAMAEGREEDAVADYRDAVLSLSAVGADRSAAQLWFELGLLFENVDDQGASSDAFKRAAASAGLVSMNAHADAVIDVRV